MVQIAGKYKLEKNENFGTYLISLGAPEELAKKAETPGLTLDVIVEGNKYSFNSSSNIKLSFTVGQEFDEPLPIQGVNIKSIAKLDGNKVIIASTAPDGRVGTRIYEFTDSGLVVTYVSNDITAKRHYTRV